MVKGSKPGKPFREPDFEEAVGLTGEMSVSVAMTVVTEAYREAAKQLPAHDGPLFKLHGDAGECAISWCVWKK